MPEPIAQVWTVVSPLVLFAVSLWASAHAILHKREVHASISWAGLIWLAPGIGALAYLLLGRNRIRRRAAEMRRGLPRPRAPSRGPGVTNSSIPAALGREAPQLIELSRVVEEATGAALLPGNHIEALVDGDEAYPAMLAAIESAETSVALASYIFESSRVGQRFIDALAQARTRGVEVRVLVDDVGVRYSLPTVDRLLRARGVPVARFLPAWRAPYFNLRNHRKLLVIDGRMGFAGGINIRAGHVLKDNPKHPIRDLEFRLSGPIVGTLMEVFAEDWEFTTGEALAGKSWFPPLSEVGPTLSRGIIDGPDADFEKVRWAFLGGISCARKSLRILTPYFLPDDGIATALNLAAMRGVDVHIVVPQHGNLPVVQWAMWGHLDKVLAHGCHVWLSPPPFDHSKLLVVDDCWFVLGSPNWDPRSLRLNFELGVECYDPELAGRMGALIDERIRRSSEVTMTTTAGRSLAVRLRDGIARLLTPYL